MISIKECDLKKYLKPSSKTESIKKGNAEKFQWKQGLNRGLNNPKSNSGDITQKQAAILDMYVNQKLSPKDIADRLQISFQRVYQIIKKLRRKGLLKQGVEKVVGMSQTGGTKLVTPLWRCHKLHFLVKPYYFSQNGYRKYNESRKKIGNTSIVYDVWNVRLHKDSIRIQLREKEDFADENIHEAVRKAQESLHRSINQISSAYGFAVFKNRKANIRIVEQHFAKTPSEFADAIEKEYLTIRGKDNKIRLLIDKSLGSKEIEYVHPDTAYRDAEKLEPFLIDFMDNDPPKNSELLEQLTTVAMNQDIYNKNIKKHLGVLDEMSKTMKHMRRELRENRGKKDFLFGGGKRLPPSQSLLLQYC